MKTTIEWISTDVRLPPPGARIVALAPIMRPFGGGDTLDIIQCHVAHDGYRLLGPDGQLDWEADSLMWWANAPNWMSAPGWRKS